MRSFLRSPAVVLFLILALPVACVAEANVLGLQPRPLRIWFWGWALACAVMGMLRLPTASSFPNLGQPAIDEPGTERALRVVEQLAAAMVDIVALIVAPFSPTATLLIVAVAISWIGLWSIPQVRRVRITSSFDIRCDQKAAFTLISDARNLPLWRDEYESVELVTPEPIGPFSRFRERMRVPPDGHLFDAVDQIVDFEPNRRFTYWVSSSVRPNFDEWTFDAVDGGTRVTQRFDFEYSFAIAVMGELFAQRQKNRLIMAGRRAGETRLKQILETGGTETTNS
jgi:hypothetical protein